MSGMFPFGGDPFGDFDEAVFWPFSEFSEEALQDSSGHTPSSQGSETHQE